MFHIEVTETGFIKEYDHGEETNQLRHVIKGIAMEGNSPGGEIVQERSIYIRRFGGVGVGDFTQEVRKLTVGRGWGWGGGTVTVPRSADGGN